MKADRAERYFDSQAWVYNMTRRHFLKDRAKAIELLDSNEEDSVVEFGCGTGLNFEYLYRSGVRSVTGIDASRGMLERARRRYPGAKLLHDDFVNGELDLEADRVLCAYTLSLVDQWEKALLNMKDILGPDGCLVVLDFHPMKGILRPLDPFFRWWIGVHGADPTRPVATFLRDHFRDVSEYVPSYGFDVIVKASSPRQ